MSIYDKWETDRDAERDGIRLNYGDGDWLLCARAGGSNTRYTRRVNQLYTRYRRQLEGGLIKDEVLTPELIRIYADTIVIDGVLHDREERAVQLKGNRDAVIKFFEDMPDLFADVRTQCGGMENFLTVTKEDDAKN